MLPDCVLLTLPTHSALCCMVVLPPTKKRLPRLSTLCFPVAGRHIHTVAPSLACDYELVPTDTHCHHHTVPPPQFQTPVLHPHAGAYRGKNTMLGSELVCDSVLCVSAQELVGHAIVFHHVGQYVIGEAVPAHHVLPVSLVSTVRRDAQAGCSASSFNPQHHFHTHLLLLIQ